MKRLGTLALVAVASGCAGVSERPAVRYEPVSFSELPGWSEAALATGFGAFRKSCAAGRNRAADAAFRGPIAIDPAAWQAACRAAAALSRPSAAALRVFFEQQFEPHRVLGADGPEGLFTGYYEPTLAAARSRRRGYEVAIHAVPPNLSATPSPPLAPRAAIESGEAGRDWPVLYWAKDPVDVFTLHIQGSGRLMLADGGTTRIAYAGNNGHDYVAIGRLMRERGLLPPERVNMPEIRAWLRANTEAGRALMRENPRYIFFRRIEGRGPVGQGGVALTPMASLAVDPRYIPGGAPLWLETTWPADKQRPLRALVVAQDAGAAIKGAVRGDLFWGGGAAALEQAGRMAERGRYYLLLPKPR